MEYKKLIIKFWLFLIGIVIISGIVLSNAINVHAMPPNFPVIMSGKIISQDGSIYPSSSSKDIEIKINYYTSNNYYVGSYVSPNNEGVYAFQLNDIDTNKPVVISISGSKTEIYPRPGIINEFTLKEPNEGLIHKIIRGIGSIFSRDDSDSDSSELKKKQVSNTVVNTQSINSENELVNNQEIEIISNDDTTSDTKSENNYLTTIVLLIVGVFMLIVVVSIIDYTITSIMSGKISSRASIPSSKISGMYAEKLIGKSKDTFEFGDTAYDALQHFVKHSDQVIPVTFEGKVYGIVTKRDLLMIYDKYDDLQKVKVHDIMTKKYVLASHDENFSEIYKKLTKSENDVVIITKNEKYIGMITYYDFIELFHDKKPSFQNNLMVGDANTDEVIFEEDNITVHDLINKFISRKLDYCIVRKDDVSLGIITLKDLINAIAGSVDMKKYYSQNIMSSSLMIMYPENMIVEALDVMHDLKFKQIPVSVDKKVVGIINEKSIVQLYCKKILEKKID